MNPQVLLATRNQHKLAELRRILTPLIAIDVIGLDDVRQFDEVPESGATFAENALIKARAACEHTGLVTVADDSGLCVDALNGMPGVLSARWAGRDTDDRANLRLVLDQLADVPDDRLGATFECAVVVVWTDPNRPDPYHSSPLPAQTVHGTMPGRLIRDPAGSGGFGYDPIFVPAGHTRTSAELEPREKDAISHRGQALRAAAPILAGLFE